MFDLLKKEKKALINVPDQLESVASLIEVYRLPVTRVMLLRLGKSEGLSETETISILDKSPKRVSNIDQAYFCKCYLEKIVLVLILQYQTISHGHYKSLVNVVNGLRLDISFFDKTIRNCQKFTKTSPVSQYVRAN
jgi:hypothetical protein